MKMMSQMKLIILGALLFSVSGCSSYRSSFSCPASKGASCTRMDKVYEMIKSGEIEKYDSTSKKCKGRRCAGKKREEDEIMRILRGGK